MAFATSITDVLNQWAQAGVFSYVIPFLLIFAVVFAIIQKTKILGEESKGISAIIAAAIGLLALQFDFVSTFFATLFPRFGVAIAILVAVVILIGFFYGGDVSEMKWVGYVLGIGVVIWALVNWNIWNDNTQIGFWIEQNFWTLVIAALVIIAIIVVAGGGSKKKAKKDE